MNTQKQLRDFAERLWSRGLRQLLQKKGDQYAGQEDHALANFMEAAKIWDSSIPEEMLQYATKHWCFLVRWAKDGASTMRDKARVSAWDIIIYMILLLFWLQLAGEPSVTVADVKEGD